MHGPRLVFASGGSSLVLGALALILWVGATPADAATPTCDGRSATIVGTPGNDTLVGTPGNDVIVAEGGADVIKGMGGSDLICAGGGEDTVRGGGGNDTIFGGPRSDVLVGGPGSDYLIGGADDDTLEGDEGDDTLKGGSGHDAIDGGPGNNTCIDVVADCDTTAPELVSFSFSPTSIDTSGGSEQITFTAHITDDLAGNYMAEVWFCSPSGQFIDAIFDSSALVSGTALDGAYEFTATVPQYSEQGRWTVAYFHLRDNARNSRRLTAEDMTAAGFPTSFSNSSP